MNSVDCVLLVCKDLRGQDAIAAVKASIHTRTQHGTTLCSKLSSADRVQHINESRVAALAVHLLQIKALLDQSTPQWRLKTKPRTTEGRIRTSKTTNNVWGLGHGGKLEKIPTEHHLHATHDASIASCFDGNAVYNLGIQGERVRV